MSPTTPATPPPRGRASTPSPWAAPSPRRRPSSRSCSPWPGARRRATRRRPSLRLRPEPPPRPRPARTRPAARRPRPSTPEARTRPGAGHGQGGLLGRLRRRAGPVRLRARAGSRDHRPPRPVGGARRDAQHPGPQARRGAGGRHRRQGDAHGDPPGQGPARHRRRPRRHAAGRRHRRHRRVEGLRRRRRPRGQRAEHVGRHLVVPPGGRRHGRSTPWWRRPQTARWRTCPRTRTAPCRPCPTGYDAGAARAPPERRVAGDRDVDRRPAHTDDHRAGRRELHDRATGGIPRGRARDRPRPAWHARPRATSWCRRAWAEARTSPG